MAERDVRASPRQDQSSLAAPHAASLPSMHAPHQTTQQQHQQQQHDQQHHHHQHPHSSSTPYPPSQSTHYAPSSNTGQSHQPQRHYYDHQPQHLREGPGPQLQPQLQPPHYDYGRQSSAPVALPSIQHLDAANSSTGSANMNSHEHSSSATPNNRSTSENNNIGRQTLPHPLPPQHPTQSAHSYAPQPNTTNGDARHPYPHQPPAAYAPHYPAQPYQPYPPGELHHHHAPPHPQASQPLPPNALMPSNVHNGHAPPLRYGLPPTLQLDPRQMSGGRHKKEIKRRTKTGCLTCRKRRIKCDERHPHCRNCEKSKRECLGYDPVFKSQPAPPTLQPAPLPNQMPKTEASYRYAYHNPEDMYAARPGQPPQQQQQHPPAPAPMQPQPPPLINGGYSDHGAAPLADGDHNRGQPHAHGPAPELASKR